MLFGFAPAELGLVLLIAFATGSGVLALALPFLSPSGPEVRARKFSSSGKAEKSSRRQPTGSRLIDGPKDSRRKQIQESIKQIEERSRERKGGLSLKTQIARAGLSLSPRKYWVFSLLLGMLFWFLPVLFAFPWYVAVLSAIAATLGLPRWLLSNLARRRQNAFIEDLPDAIDVMVRGLKSGLPLSDAMRVIAAEAGPPVGPEFMEVVEGQRLGITIDQGLERMFVRMPLPEVSFLGIVISIQSKAGGNLSEALGNLSRVLRERKKLKGKIRSLSQEAKTSAAIIGSLPFFIMGILVFASPHFLDPLMTTSSGHMVLGCAAAMMIFGILVMRSMINFKV